MVTNPRKRKSRGAAPSPAKVALVEAEGPVQASERNSAMQAVSTHDLIEETRKVLASLDPQASIYHPRHRPEDHRINKSDPSQEAKNEVISSALSLAAFKLELLGQKENRRTSHGGVAEREAVDAAGIDWQMYRDWPEGIAAEEEAMRSYFSRLKFVYLEQATKYKFLTRKEEGEEGGLVYKESAIQAAEQQAAVAKAELKAAKQNFRDLRSQIDAIADSIIEPFAQLEAQQAEARAVVSSIKDMELELAKIRATTGSSRNPFDINSTVPPKFGTMTLEEAESYNELQLREMQVLQEGTTEAQQLAKDKQKELASLMRAVERLNVERKREEKYAEEVGKDGGRDLEVEHLCEERTAQLNQLTQLLGISSIDAPSETELCLAFKSAVKQGKRIQAEDIKLVLQYDVPGGKLVSYAIVRPDDSDATLPEDHLALIDAAFRANDAQLLIQELWRATGAAASSEA